MGKIAVSETSLVKKNHQIATIVKQKIAQKLIEKVPMTAIAESLSVSTSTVIHKLKEFKFKTDLSFQLTCLWSETVWGETVSAGFKKGKMSFIAQDFDSLKIVTSLDECKQPFAITFCAIPDKSETKSKSLLWTCLGPTTTS